MTATWLLPVVTLIVASSSGGVIAPIIQQYSASHALVTVATSIVMVTIGLSLALMILTIYLLRLITYGLPPCATIISVFLPLGPTGQAGYSILLIGQFFNSVLPYSPSSSSSRILTDPLTGKIINVICLSISFVLWSLASMWVLFAILGVQDVVRVQRSKIPFKVPFWGLIFPNGVYANLTISLGQTLDSQFFRVFGAIYACFTITAWLFVATRTVLMVRTREIFEAPCLEDIEIDRHRSVPQCSRISGVSRCQSATAPLTDKEESETTR
jgi:tellurite resistance protein TehA-like permease